MVDSLPDAALYYAERDFSVFPVRSRGKAPLIPKVEGGHGCKDATNDLRQVAELWKRYPNANIGMALGRASHDLVVVDIDGKDGQDSIREWNLHIPETVVARTGREGGFHYYFVAPGMGCRNDLFSGIDIKGDGGYVVVPPSVHKSGRHYTWSEDRFGRIQFAAAPEWILTAMQSGAGGPGGANAASRRNSLEWEEYTSGRYTIGSRRTALLSLAGKVMRSNLDRRIGAELLWCWTQIHCDPPLPDAEAQRIIRDVARLEKEKP